MQIYTKAQLKKLCSYCIIYTKIISAHTDLIKWLVTIPRSLSIIFMEKYACVKRMKISHDKNGRCNY